MPKLNFMISKKLPLKNITLYVGNQKKSLVRMLLLAREPFFIVCLNRLYPMVLLRISICQLSAKLICGVWLHHALYLIRCFTESDTLINLVYLFSNTSPPSAVWSMVIGFSRLTSSDKIFLLKSFKT